MLFAVRTRGNVRRWAQNEVWSCLDNMLRLHSNGDAYSVKTEIQMPLQFLALYSESVAMPFM